MQIHDISIALFVHVYSLKLSSQFPLSNDAVLSQCFDLPESEAYLSVSSALLNTAGQSLTSDKTQDKNLNLSFQSICQNVIPPSLSTVYTAP